MIENDNAAAGHWYGKYAQRHLDEFGLKVLFALATNMKVSNELLVTQRTMSDVRRVADEIAVLREYLSQLCNHLMNPNVEGFPLPSKPLVPTKLLRPLTHVRQKQISDVKFDRSLTASVALLLIPAIILPTALELASKHGPTPDRVDFLVRISRAEILCRESDEIEHPQGEYVVHVA